MKKELEREILASIATAGNAEAKVKIIIGGNLNHILNLSSGSPRLQTNVISRFKLILSQPAKLSMLNPFEIRCCLCNRVISYPAWYYTLSFNVNQFHYFICFDSDNAHKPTAKCYRRI